MRSWQISHLDNCWGKQNGENYYVITCSTLDIFYQFSFIFRYHGCNIVKILQNLDSNMWDEWCENSANMSGVYLRPSDVYQKEINFLAEFD